MATDVEARDTGNSAMIIAIVAVILIAIGAFAYFSSGGTRVVETPGSTSSTTVVNQPAAPAPDVHVDVPAPVVVNGGSGSAPASAPSGGSTDAAPAAKP